MAMDSVDPLAVTAPSVATLSASASPRLKDPRRPRIQTPPQCAAGRDNKPRKASPLTPRAFPAKTTPTTAKTTTKWISRNLARGPSAASKPLLPLSERRYCSDKGDTALRLDNGTATVEIAPDGTSAGREGRQFTVSNVGNNGRIYLRPSVRPAHQRYPQPNFAFPVTPPSTAVMDRWSQSNRAKLIESNNTTNDKRGEDDTSFQIPPWTPTISATPPASKEERLISGAESSTRLRRRRRAMSDSTVHEANTTRIPDSQALRIAISAAHNRGENRPRTIDDLSAIAGPPVLNVNIPSWRLGTPRFTLRGTPLLRGSSYAPTDDVRSSSVSGLNSSSLIPRSSFCGGGTVRRANTLAFPKPGVPFDTTPRGAAGMSSPRSLRPSRSTYMSPHVVIDPAMFTNLTFRPFCDDGQIVRYSSTGAVTAATPSRLVAEITSPSFLDYELLSDFFLTFRSFLEPSDLLRMLVARLRWALDRDDEIGMIVRVRTFVALRHWILNYFMDDFIVEYSLRITFCNLLNDFVDELSQDDGSRKVQLKILAELKKCWRRVCAQYWDGDEFDDTLGPEVAITPGGLVGSRDPHLDPARAPETLSSEPDPRCAVMTTPSPCPPQTHANLRKDIPHAITVGDFVVLDNRPATPENQTSGAPGPDQVPTSPGSLASTDIVSCSFPGKIMKIFDQNMGHRAAAHPVPSTALGNVSGTIATTPKTLVGKRVRPAQTHKRNNSLSDSLREHQTDPATCADHESLPALFSGGRLVRGNLLPPGHAVVDVDRSERPGHAHRQTTVFRSKSSGYPKDGIMDGAMSVYGMRKLLRSVRNALKHRGHGLCTTPQALADIRPAGPRSATLNRLPGTAVVPQEAIRQNGSRPAVRIDLLGAEVAEDFKKAIREEEEEAAAAAAAAASTAAAGPGPGPVAQYVTGISSQAPPTSVPSLPSFAERAASRSDWAIREASAQDNEQRPLSDMGITVGSKSIVIVDDTMPFETFASHGMRGVEITSADSFGDSFMPVGANPTPPNTPPSLNFDGETARRSSCLVNEHAAGPSMIQNVSPRVISDLATLERCQSTRAWEDNTRPTTSATRHDRQWAPESCGQAVYRLHRRTRSSKSHKSVNSVLHRRVTSLGSINVSPARRNLDATTDFGELEKAASSQAPLPEPLRVLRRRPGGDLKAVTNVGQLDRSGLRRSQSVGSIFTHTESFRSSYILSARSDSAGGLDARSLVSGGQGRTDTFSLSQAAERPRKQELSLLSTQSLRPAMRLSFEAEALKLAQIPDDEDDGVESALLKLEGKYPAKKPINLLSIMGQGPPSVEDMGLQVANDKDDDKPPSIPKQVDSADSRKMTGRANVEARPAHAILGEALLEEKEPEARPSVRVSSSFLSEGSHDSYCSIPLLQRDPDDEACKRVSRLWTERPILRGPGRGEATYEPGQMQFHTLSTGQTQAHSSFDLIYETSSMEDIGPRGEKVHPVVSVMEAASFSNDDSADGSDPSSSLSGHDDEDGVMGDGIGGNFARREADMSPVGPVSDYAFSAHLVLHGSTVTESRPASPQITFAQALTMSPEGVAAPVEADAWPRKPLPPTPELTPVMGCSESPRLTAVTRRVDVPDEALCNTTQPNTTPKHSVHLPFILAFDSCVLAQQFTLIEKDALTEIDWRELIDLSWKHFATSDVRSWVDFLRNIDAQGVDVVIARFNIMVKWAISEIVLTQDMEERARCIIKLIHIAAHCRRYRNFATLAQLTIALSSKEISRLSKTWELVPESDLKTLNDLEVLVTPSRNFHNMREEMEVGTSSGCIPFVGIYTHDLLYNAQRPAEITTSPTTAPLVNFERCRMGAAVVKTLLRLMEASTRYTFLPIEGVTERCLWIGALSDDEIRKYSRNLE
ncbi:hypothetical protein E4U42_004362 [Claviceps africana]|uniref:Uncharacterized protein n=1 Tax=Claviceps africana TaxID=83212 RepID=A0A8K0JC16_9HYPO|nr:hypothetical protein E4U42_004362 [Claviceps africana]